MFKLRISMMCVVLMSLPLASFAQNGGIGACVGKFALDMTSASFDFGICTSEAYEDSGMLECEVNPPTTAEEVRDCNRARLNFALMEGVCASTYMAAITAAAEGLDDCLGDITNPPNPEERNFWLRLKDIQVFIDIESQIQEIEALLSRLTDQVIIDEFFDFLRKEDFKGAALYMKEAYEIDPVSELPDQWNAMVTAVESAGFAEYFSNPPPF